MSPRVLLVAVIAVIAIAATVSAIVTAPEMLAARRVHRRLPVATTADGAVSTIDRFRSGALVSLGPTRPGSVRALLERRARHRLDLRVPDALERVVRRLRSGSTLASALQAVGEEDPVLARVARELAQGRSLQESVQAWRAEDDRPNRMLAATALELASTTGGASAGVLDGVAASLRERIGLEREVAALSSQSRASAVVLIVAPVAFAAAAAMVDHRILEALVGRPIGWACIGLGLGLDAIGGLWMARLIGRHR